MIRFAILGSDSSHAEIYGQLLNSPTGPLASRARASVIWGEDRAEAERKGRQFGVEAVASTPEEAIAQADAVLVLSRFQDSHVNLAEMAVRRNLPTYVDKLFSDDPEETKALITLAEERGVALTAFSPYRKAGVIQKWRNRRRLSRRPASLVVTGPRDCNDLKGDSRFQDIGFYGIHSVEMAAEIAGDVDDSFSCFSSEPSVSALFASGEGLVCQVSLLAGLPGEDYRLAWLSESETEATRLSFDEGDLYRSALQGIWDELISRETPLSARSNLRSIEILARLRHAAQQKGAVVC